MTNWMMLSGPGWLAGGRGADALALFPPHLVSGGASGAWPWHSARQRNVDVAEEMSREECRG